MALPHILVTDDDPEIGRLLGKYLEGQGFRCTLATERKSCEARLADTKIDLLVLDVMLPDGSGLDICRDLKERRPQLPIILLTALKEDVDRIVGLELGADDYLGKPFNPRELAARIKAVLRRMAPQAESNAQEDAAAIYTFEGFTADPRRRTVVRGDGEEIPVTGAEFDLLMIFLERPNRVLSRDLLMDHLHGRSVEPYDRAIDVTMSRLRRKLDDGGKFKLFKTVRNGGYQFAAAVEKQTGGRA
ncbi:response regulator transcription factor [Fulvimarina sp. MAC8]|uniref:response regulator transcription factor n=1 Tax=Fulvimarina sp. MAC8 TaxID=3162874 RepID=UPI0032EC98EB